jgi:hypothetical protein
LAQGGPVERLSEILEALVATHTPQSN